MERPDVDAVRKWAKSVGSRSETPGTVVVALCDYIILLEGKDGWTHKGACAWFKDCCELMMWDDPPYSWFVRLCRSYGYELTCGVFRRYVNGGKTVLDLRQDRGGNPLAYFTAICENIRAEQKAKDPEGPTPPYRKEYEGSDA